MIRWDNSKSLIKTVDLLRKKNIVEATSNNVEITNPILFYELFFSIFTLWTIQTLRSKEFKSFLIYKLLEDSSLICIQSTDFKNPSLIFDKEPSLLTIYGKLEGNDIVAPNYVTCPFCSKFRYNLSIASSEFTIPDWDSIPFFEVCENNHIQFANWMSNNMDINYNYGWMMGGLTIKVNCPVDLLKDLLAATEESDNIQMLLEELLILHLVSKVNKNIKGYSAHTYLTNPFNSFELDGLICDYNEDNINEYKLFVIENTNGFEMSDSGNQHKKQKLLMYYSLEKLHCQKIKYIYFSLKKFLYGKNPSELESVLKYNFDKSENIVLLSLEDVFTDIQLKINSDKITRDDFGNYFSTFLNMHEQQIHGFFE